MTVQTRRRFLRGGLALAGSGSSPAAGSRRSLPWQAAKVPRIGFLAVGSREGRAFLIDGLLQGLREHGYDEGRNILIEYRFSEGRNERLPELAAELVALNGGAHRGVRIAGELRGQARPPAPSRS